MITEEMRDVLRDRAKKIAGKEAQDNTKTIEVVEFTLADEHYAIESIYIREVYPFKNFTPLPCTPYFVMGIINVRRRIISVINLRALFNLPAGESENNQKVIILEYQDKEFAIITNAIIGVRLIPLQEIQSGLPTLTGVRQDFLKGITAQQLVILDGEKLLTSEEMIVIPK